MHLRVILALGQLWSLARQPRLGLQACRGCWGAEQWRELGAARRCGWEVGGTMSYGWAFSLNESAIGRGLQAKPLPFSSTSSELERWCHHCVNTVLLLLLWRWTGLKRGVTHAEEVGDKGLLGCSVTEMWSLNCTFSSGLLTFLFSHPKTFKNKIQEFRAVFIYQWWQCIWPQQFSIHSDLLFCSSIFCWVLSMYKDVTFVKTNFGLIKFLMCAEAVSSLKCSLLFLD